MEQGEAPPAYFKHFTVISTAEYLSKLLKVALLYDSAVGRLNNMLEEERN
jgi:hypothetical protein